MVSNSINCHVRCSHVGVSMCERAASVEAREHVCVSVYVSGGCYQVTQCHITDLGLRYIRVFIAVCVCKGKVLIERQPALKSTHDAASSIHV